MKLLHIFALAVLAACGSYRFPDQPAPEPSSRVIAGVRDYTSTREWRRSPWYRVSTDLVMDLPVYLLVTGDGSACIVSGMVWAKAQDRPHQRLPCFSGWRFPRR